MIRFCQECLQHGDALLLPIWQDTKILVLSTFGFIRQSCGLFGQHGSVSRAPSFVRRGRGGRNSRCALVAEDGWRNDRGHTSESLPHLSPPLTKGRNVEAHGLKHCQIGLPTLNPEESHVGSVACLLGLFRMDLRLQRAGMIRRENRPG